jgi:hypothetical protein
MNAKRKSIAISLTTSLGLAAAFLLYFLWFHSAQSGRDGVLSLMPGNSETVLFVDLHDMRQAPFFADLIAWAPKPTVDADSDQFRRDTGFDYEKDLERIAMALEKHGKTQTFFAVANGRFDQKKIKDYAAKSGSVQKQAGTEIFSLPVTGRPERISFTFLSKDLIAFTNAGELVPFLNPSKTSDSADWHVRFERVAGSPLFAILRGDGIADALGSQPGAQSLAQRATGGLTSPQLSSLLAQLQWISAAAKPQNDRLRIIVEGESSEERNARQLADLLNGVALLARAGLGGARTQQQIAAPTRDAYIELLKSVEVSRIDRGDTKSVRLMFDVTPQLLRSVPSSTPATVPAAK